MVSAQDHVPLVFLVAGETSGDLVGARMMQALRRLCASNVRFDGVGGNRMAAEGLVSRFAYTELSLVGVTEVVPHIPKLIWRMGQTARTIRELKPAVVLFIDASGFSRGVARRLKRDAIPLIQYKAPQAWAYWPWRARKMAKYFDHVFTILPFEPEFFAGYGVKSSFIGHPAVESGAGKGDGKRFRARHNIPADSPLLCLLPGSRWSEIKWSLDEYAVILEKLSVLLPDMRVVVPAINPVTEAVITATAGWRVPTVVTTSDSERFDAFAASDAALAVSGTVTAELAVSLVPMVICYRVSRITAAVGRRIIRVKYASVGNLVLDRPVIPEFIQENCTADNIVPALHKLLTDSTARSAQIQEMSNVNKMLRAGELLPTESAARFLMNYIVNRA